MGSLYYVGKNPASDGDLVTQAEAKWVFNNVGVTHDYVIDQITARAALKVTKSQVDSWDSAYAPVNYYQTQDQLLLPLSAKGAIGGVATLTTGTALAQDSTTGYVISPAQLPALGAGIMRGPYGMSKQYSRGGIGATPALVGEWIYSADNTGFTMPVTGYLLAFLSVAAQNTGGRTILEVRAGKSKSYADQALVATGYGRTWFDGYQVITVLPAASGNPATLDQKLVFDVTTTVYVNLWIYNEGGGKSNVVLSEGGNDGASNVTAGMVYTSPLYVVRTEQ